MTPGNTDKKSARLLAEWIEAERAIEVAEASVTTAKLLARTRRDRVGESLTPSDMYVGEQIGIWATADCDDEAKCYVIKLVSNANGKTYNVSTRK